MHFATIVRPGWSFWLLISQIQRVAGSCRRLMNEQAERGSPFSLFLFPLSPSLTSKWKWINTHFKNVLQPISIRIFLNLPSLPSYPELNFMIALHYSKIISGFQVSRILKWFVICIKVNCVMINDRIFFIIPFNLESVPGKLDFKCTCKDEKEIQNYLTGFSSYF